MAIHEHVVDASRISKSQDPSVNSDKDKSLDQSDKSDHIEEFITFDGR